MSHALFRKGESAIPEPHDIALAEQSSKELAALLSKKNEDLIVSIKIGEDEAPITLPSSAIHLLLRILTEMAQGNAVTLIPIHANLTTQEAADLLNVSRPFLIKLLESGDIPFEKVGTHRRIRAEALVKYKEKSEIERLSALEDLTKQAQDLDMGY